jgi:hypothetical protein
MESKYNGVAPQKEWDKIEFAFASGGVNYFRYVSDGYVPFMRWANAYDIYMELENGLSPTVLKKYNQTLRSICENPKIKSKEGLIAKLAVQIELMNERLEMANSLTLNIKLASVLYFDETENIFGYNYDYNLKKIEAWTKNQDIEDFFLRLPQSVFFPSQKDFRENFLTFMEGQKNAMETLMKGEVVQIQKFLETLSTLDTSEMSKEEWQNYYSYQTTLLQILKVWHKKEYGSIALSEPNS